MKYIRTKNSILEVFMTNCGDFNTKKGWIKPSEVLKQADTLEELMMIDDLVFKKNGDIFVIANQAYIDYYINHQSVAKLFIKDSKGNYIRVAEENDKGELELL